VQVNPATQGSKDTVLILESRNSSAVNGCAGSPRGISPEVRVTATCKEEGGNAQVCKSPAPKSKPLVQDEPRATPSGPSNPEGSKKGGDDGKSEEPDGVVVYGRDIRFRIGARGVRVLGKKDEEFLQYQSAYIRSEAKVTSLVPAWISGVTVYFWIILLVSIWSYAPSFSTVAEELHKNVDLFLTLWRQNVVGWRGSYWRGACEIAWVISGWLVALFKYVMGHILTNYVLSSLLRIFLMYLLYRGIRRVVGTVTFAGHWLNSGASDSISYDHALGDFLLRAHKEGVDLRLAVHLACATWFDPRSPQAVAGWGHLVQTWAGESGLGKSEVKSQSMRARSLLMFSHEIALWAASVGGMESSRSLHATNDIARSAAPPRRWGMAYGGHWFWGLLSLLPGRSLPFQNTSR
jgi:hypothetical protein